MSARCLLVDEVEVKSLHVAFDMPKTEQFEKHSDAYDEWFDKHRDLYEAELEAIRQLIPPPGAEGLEVGVGTGKFAAPLGIKIGVEPSGEMAIKARNLGINVFASVAEDLPFSDDRFDFVLMVTTICFFDDVIASFREAFRVLKASGCIVVGFVDRAGKLGRQYEEKREESKFYKDATFLSAQEVLECLELAGFRSEKIKQTIISGVSPETILDDSGRGAFVVVRGVK